MPRRRRWCFLQAARGNLTLATVRDLMGRFRMNPDVRLIHDGERRLLEQDVWAIHWVRILLELAGLVKRRRKRFTLTREGRRVLGDQSAGELFAHLFAAHFTKLSFAYIYRIEWPELQYQTAFTLSRLTTLPSEWRTPEDLLPRVVLPFALQQAYVHRFEYRHSMLERCVLDALVRFGLLACRVEEGVPDWQAVRRYRAEPDLHILSRSASDVVSQ